MNNKAVDSLRATAPQLYRFYHAQRQYLIDHSLDPDNWRRFDRSEGPRHYLNIDNYGSEAPFPALPRDRKKADALFGKAFIIKGGLAPWTIEHRYRLLVAAFRRRDARDIVFQSAILGHYVGDVHVPVHATANYDGQLTKQKGLHGRFESEMVDRSIDESQLEIAGARRIANPTDAAFNWIIDSWKMCEPVFKADLDASAKDALYGTEYYEIFTPRALPIAKSRLESAASDLGSLWYSAWLEAGRPALPRLKTSETNTQMKTRP